jgi:hypothetical protein
MTTDFRASLLDLRKQIDSCLAIVDDPTQWRPCESGLPADGFCLGNWRIVPRFPENTPAESPAESPESSRKAFDAWFNAFPCFAPNERCAWVAWKAYRAQLNSPPAQPLAH